MASNLDQNSKTMGRNSGETKSLVQLSNSNSAMHQKAWLDHMDLAIRTGVGGGGPKPNWDQKEGVFLSTQGMAAGHNTYKCSFVN